MKKYLPLLSIILTLVIALHSPRSPAQIQPAATQDFQPPQLLTPENGSTVKGAPEFFWTSAVLPKGFKGSYRLKVVPITQGQDPKAALGGNSPMHQATMRRTGEAYPADGPALKDGQTYAWGVQVVDANGVPVRGDQGLSDVFVFTFAQTAKPSLTEGLTITTQPLVMTGMRVGSLTIDTQPLVMTGLRVGSITINTDSLVMTGMRVSSITVNTEPLVMTGMRVQSISVNTQPLVMTGMRVGSLTVNTDPLVMTGMRVEPITVKTDALKMTGMRNEHQKPPVESDKTPIKSTVQDELKKKAELPSRKMETDDGGTKVNQPPDVKEPKQKLDLPSKKQGTIDGANPPAGQPDGAQMQQSGSGKTVGDTALNRVLGKIPSLKTPSVPEKPADGAAKSTIQQKIGEKKTPDEVKK
jgi:hypothetical protein